MGEQHCAGRGQERGADLWLAFEDIEAGGGDGAAREGVDEGSFVDNGPARGVDEHGRWTHHGQDAPVDECSGLDGQRHVDAEDVDVGGQLVERATPALEPSVAAGVVEHGGVEAP